MAWGNQDIMESILRFCCPQTMLELWDVSFATRNMVSRYLLRDSRKWIAHQQDRDQRALIQLSLKLMSVGKTVSEISDITHRLSIILGPNTSPYPTLESHTSLANEAPPAVPAMDTIHQEVDSVLSDMDINNDYSISYSCDVLYMRCHSHTNKASFSLYQNALAGSPKLTRLVASAGNAGLADGTRERIFRLLGQMCFRNPRASAVVGRTTDLVTSVLSVISSTDMPDSLRYTALYSFVAPASNTWDIHQSLYPIVPHCVNHIRAEIQAEKDGVDVPTAFQKLRLTCEQFIVTLSYNPESRSFINSQEIIGLLLLSLKMDSTHHPSAALTLANLIQAAEGSFLTDEDLNIVVGVLLDVLEACCAGRPYPPASYCYFTPWKVTMGFHNLSTSNIARHILCTCPRLTRIVLNGALMDGSRDQKLINYSLRLLWNISPLAQRGDSLVII